MIRARHIKAAKLGLCVLVSFLLCSQALFPINTNYAQATGIQGTSEDALPAQLVEHATVRVDRTHRQPSESSDSVPTQPSHDNSHESESELEEKSEKEIEDDNEELDNVLEALTVVRARYSYTTITALSNVVRDVPTPPPNR